MLQKLKELSKSKWFWLALGAAAVLGMLALSYC